MVGLFDNNGRHPSRPWRGRQRRAPIARALAMRAGVMQFDGMTPAHDPEVIGEVTDMIRKLLHHDRLTQRMLAHQMGVARDTSGRVGVACGGRIGETFGNPQGERPRHSLSATKPAERWA
jgi:polar amino acid transport system ATP-binding protein